MSEIRTEKYEMREKYTAIRDAISPQDKACFDKKIFDRLVSSITYRHSKEIFLYASFKSEVDTWAIFDAAIAAGKKVAFPKCNENHTMTYRFVSTRDELEEKAFGILEPKDSCEEAQPCNFSLCIVPGLVFDKKGYRIGYGKGFYDRFLSKFPGVSIGLCYSNLIVPEVPKGRFDCHVDVIISERGVYAVNVAK